MESRIPKSCTAFAGTVRIATGSLADVALCAKRAIDTDRTLPVLVFDDETSEVVELDLRGTPDEVAARMPGPAARPRGRPRLGVVPREVTLLPRHWEWLRTQRGGASAALRRLVEQASRDCAGRDRVRRAQEVAYRFMHAMAGDERDFEEAARALFARDRERFDRYRAGWPADIADHASRLAAGAFGDD